MPNSEVGQFVERNAARVTPQIVSNLLSRLPLLKVEFTQINDTAVPHLVDQLEFLADMIEDVLESVEKSIPYYAVAAAAFALIYAHRGNDIIPDYLEGFGHLDDSAIVRYVLIRYERYFQKYCEKRGIAWGSVSTSA